MTLILGPDEIAGNVGQNEEDGNDDKWDGWWEMSKEEGSGGGDHETRKYVAKVEGGGDVSGQR